MLAPQLRRPPPKERQHHHDDDRDERYERRPHIRFRERVYGRDDATPREERAEEHEGKRGSDEHDVPHFQHAALLLNDDGVQIGRTDEPWHEARILNRVPAPEAAPTELNVGPLHAEYVAKGQEEPG